MDFIQILAVIGGVAFFILFLVWGISKLYSKQHSRVVASDSISNKMALEICLRDITYKRNIISNMYFPERSEKSPTVERYRRIEQIVVGAGGVLLLASCRETGKIDNRADDIWICIKDDERYEFNSPLASLRAGGGIISGILEQNGFREKCVYEAVVFTDNQSEPVDYSDGVVRMSELERLIKDLNDYKRFDPLEQYFIIRAIKNAGTTKDRLDRKKNGTGEKRK